MLKSCTEAPQSYDSAPDCTANFVQFGETTELQNSNLLATFQWAQILEAQTVTDLNLTWSWGDGTPNTTESTGSTSHTYAAEGTYNVCLEVSWTFEENNQIETCNAGPTCKEIKISDGNPCTEQILCGAANALAILSPNLLTNIVISDNNSSLNNMCADIEGIVFFLADFCGDIDADDITLTFNGQEGPCWETCDGPRDLVLSIGESCPVNITVNFNEAGSCESSDFDTGWGWISFDNGMSGLSIRQQTLTAANGGSNKLIAKMIRKERVSGKWKRRRAYIGLQMQRTVWGTQTCGCDRTYNPNESDFPSGRKYTRSITDDGMPDSFDGLNLDFSQTGICWNVSYQSGDELDDRTEVGTGSGCDNY